MKSSASSTKAPKLATPWAVVPLSDGGASETGVTSHWSGATVPTPWPAAYGGDLCVGALSAIMQTAAPEQQVHSLQLAFLRPGDRDRPVKYAVERVRDGFRYANRAVRVVQESQTIAIGSASLRKPHESEAQQVVTCHGRSGEPLQPESLPTAEKAIGARTDTGQLPSETDALDMYWSFERALDVRHVDPPLYGASVEPRSVNRLWVRFDASVSAQRKMLESRGGRAALIAYLADDTILEPALASQGFAWRTPGLFSTTVQQNVWFHSDFESEEWLYFDQKLVSRAGDHVVCEGSITNRAGKRIATVLQEGIVRVR